MTLFLLPVLFFSQISTVEKPREKPAEKSALSGSVVDGLTGEPINHAALRLSPAGSGFPHAASSSSDASGKFAMVDLDPGAYHLEAEHSGYVNGYYGQRNGDFGAIIRLEAGQTLSSLSIKLTPAGAIVGTIRDSNGEPVESVNVELGRIVYTDRGKPRLEHESETSSDDRGEYRFHGLRAGKYYVSAKDNRQDQGVGVVDHSAVKGPPEIEVATFYPGVADPSLASPVEVSPGKRAAGIDITMKRLRTYCVNGRLMTPSGSSPVKATAAVVYIVTAGASNNGVATYRASTTARNADGDFQFCRLAPGAYEVTGYMDPFSARTQVTVGGADVDELRLILAPRASIDGRVVAEGPEKPDLRGFNVTISLNGNERTNMGNLQSRDGVFATGAYWEAARYDVTTESPPAGFYVKSIRSGDKDVLADGLTVSGPGVVPLDITLSPDGSGLSGELLDKKEQPITGATVLVVPLERSRYDLFAKTTTDQRGHYEFSSLAPGNYTVFAWEDVQTNQWNDPDFLKGYENRAAKTVLEARTKSTLVLHLASQSDR